MILQFFLNTCQLFFLIVGQYDMQNGDTFAFHMCLTHDQAGLLNFNCFSKGDSSNNYFQKAWFKQFRLLCETC